MDTLEATRTQTRARPTSSAPALEPDELQVRAQPSLDRRGARQLPAGAYLRAIPAWFALVWGVSYLAVPTTIALTTSDQGAYLLSGILTFPAFAATVLTTAVWAAAARPSVRLARGGMEPIGAAFLGWFAVWALAQGFVEPFTPFGAMRTDVLLALIAANLLEGALVAAVLGTLQHTRARAFLLGAGFQAMQAALGASLLKALALLV